MQLTGKNLEFKHENRSNPLTVLFLMFLCVLSFFLLKAVMSRTIVSPWLPTAVPTRDALSYAMEADTYFRAGNLQKAADAYAAAAVLEPDNADYSAGKFREKAVQYVPVLSAEGEGRIRSEDEHG